MRIILTIVVGFLIMHGVVNAKSRSNGSDKAILLVAFGTTVEEAWGAFDTLENMVKEDYPNLPVSWAFTSKIVRKRLKAAGTAVDSPEEAFLKLKNVGIKHITIQSLHLIPGIEFDKLSKSIHEYADSLFEKVTIGMPLLNDQRDIDLVTKSLFTIIPEKRQKNEAVIFMGHGSENHASGQIYVTLNKLLSEKDSRVMLATVEGHPTFNQILEKIKTTQIKKCWLIPFMSVAGVHVRDDMAGDGDDSWKSILAKNEIESISLFTGIGEHRVIAQIWLDHLKDALEKGEH